LRFARVALCPHTWAIRSSVTRRRSQACFNAIVAPQRSHSTLGNWKDDLGGRRVVDVGTGSGILALAAARSGAESIIATDINPGPFIHARATSRGRRQ
jgi:methylase of polypeptide subunit release factors